MTASEPLCRLSFSGPLPAWGQLPWLGSRLLPPISTRIQFIPHLPDWSSLQLRSLPLQTSAALPGITTARPLKLSVHRPHHPPLHKYYPQSHLLTCHLCSSHLLPFLILLLALRSLPDPQHHANSARRGTDVVSSWSRLWEALFRQTFTECLSLCAVSMSCNRWTVVHILWKPSSFQKQHRPSGGCWVTNGPSGLIKK